MGTLKTCTLYYKGVNNYNHEFIIPIISMDLKSMDKFTSNYKDESSMFACLPNELKKYIKNISSKKTDFDNMFNNFILKSDTNDLDIIFIENADVTYITPKELKEEVKSVLIDKKELQKIFLKRLDSSLKLRYEFFKYLYDGYVKDKSVLKMIDTYDIKELYPSLNEDKLLTLSLATDKDNIVVLLTKIGQTNIGRRDVAIKFKKLYQNLNNDYYLNQDKIKSRFNSGLDIKDMKRQILDNLYEFKEEYEREYN